VLLIGIPLLFKKQITEIVTAEINRSVNATVTFQDANISLLKKFPNATISISDLLIVSDSSFANDTLLNIKSIDLKTSLFDVFQKGPNIKSIAIENGFVNLISNREGQTNYTIFRNKEKSIEAEATDATNFSLHVDSYQLKDINLQYVDQKSNLHLEIQNINHEGAAQLKGEQIYLQTQSNIDKLSFTMSDIIYLNSVSANLKAGLELNLKTMKFTFKENNLKINDLHLSADGFVQLNEENIAMNFNFRSNNSEFKGLLSLIPSAYSSSFQDIKTTGDLNFKGNIQGVYNDFEIPKFNIEIDTKNASFKYPELPKTVQHIFIDTKITNATGKIDDTAIAIKHLGFTIDQDVFSASSNITNLTSNPKIQATLKGTIDLKNISEAYPLSLKQKLQGNIQAEITTSFTRKALENKNFKQISSTGFIALDNFFTITELLPNPIQINTALLNFNQQNFSLNKFEAKTGSSDLKLHGSLHNLYNFIFGDGELHGDFKLSSKFLKVSDLLSTRDTASTKTDTILSIDTLKIPAKINAVLTVNTKNILYDNLLLNDFIGTIKIEDQKVVFEKTNAKMFQGDIGIEGFVDTKPTPSNFDFAFILKDLDISSSLNSLEFLHSIAPFANAINGKMSSSFKMHGGLDNNLLPDLQSISGNALANLDVDKLDPKKSKVLNLIDTKLSFIDLSKLDLKNIKTQFSVDNGTVQFKPFKIASYDGIPLQMSGTHNFNNQIDYKIKMDLPASYFGNSVSSLISNLSDSDQNNMKVPVTLSIGGLVNRPSIKTDMKSAASKLTKKIAKRQKEKLVNDLFGGATTKKDSKKQKDLKTTAKKLLKGLFQ
jgi:hypothetical protein